MTTIPSAMRRTVITPVITRPLSGLFGTGATGTLSTSTPLVGKFVATTGNNGAAGTEAAPWQTIKFALTQATAGTTIWVRGGTHSANCHQAGVTAWNTGSSFSNAITIRAYPSETVNISAQLGYDPTVNPTSFYHIWQDINFIAVTNGCVYGTAGASYIRLQNCTVSNGLAGGQGVHQQASTCNHWELIGCDIYDNGTNATLDHGCYISGSDNLIDGCLLHGNRHYGVQFYPTSVNNVIRNTKVYNNTRGIVFYDGSGNLAYNNLIYNHPAHGIGATGQTGIGIYHNTVYNNSGADGISLLSNTGGTIRNNIAYLNSPNITAGGATSDHNVTTNPSFTNPGASDFTLTAGSTICIDQGQAVGTVTTDFLGVTRNNPPDIGAFEYQGSVFFVALGGNDAGAGTIGSPWQTIASALGHLSAGDTLYIRAGTYTGKIFETSFGATGTSGSPILVAGYPGETVILQPAGSQGNVARFANSSIQYVTLRNLTLDGTGEAVGTGGGQSILYCGQGSANIRCESVVFQNGEGNGTLCYGSSHTFIDCQWLSNGWDASYGNSNGFYGSDCDNCVIDGGVAYNNEGSGIRFWTSDAGTATGNVVKNLRAYQNGRAKGLNGTSTSSSGGCGINLGDTNNAAINCLIYDNYFGFQVNNGGGGGATQIKVYHCTFHGNTHGLEFLAGTSMEIKNCISYANGDTDLSNGIGGNLTQVSNQTTNPSFVNSGIRDYRLASGSTAINTGTFLSSPSAVLTDFVGVTRDNPPNKGAYEGAF